LQQLYADRAASAVSIQMRLVRKDGSVCWVDQRVTPLRDRDGNLEALEGVVRDMGGGQRADAEYLNAELLRRELEAEKERNVLRERLISVVNHDVRTSMTVIRTSGDILSRYFERISPTERFKYLRTIQTQVCYMNHLLETLLVADKARSGKLEPELASLDVVLFCREILDHVEIFDEARHRFVFISQGSVDGFTTDANLVRRILLNLLSNAMKYSPEGSEIQLEVSAQNEEVLLRVSDRGIGIPTADQGQIFEWFKRASNTGKIAGTGLGLAIVKSAVDALGGSVTLSSQQGQGTTFDVHLPIFDNRRNPQ